MRELIADETSSSTESPTPTLRVNVSKALVREFAQRELAHAPFDRITKAGRYVVTAEELRELTSDAEYQADLAGCSGIEFPSQTKRMYRRFHRELCAVFGAAAASLASALLNARKT